MISVAFNSAAQHNSMTKLVGTISCESEIRDIDIEILSLSILPKNSSFATSIPVTSKTQISIPIDSIGTGSHNFEYKIDGPLSRIAHSEQILRLTESDDFLIIDIDPNNLLSNNMIVNGVIEISDSNDNLWVVEVVLTAESSAAKSLNDYIKPWTNGWISMYFCRVVDFLNYERKSICKYRRNHRKTVFPRK